jgi:hypothetical protein
VRSLNKNYSTTRDRRDRFFLGLVRGRHLAHLRLILHMTEKDIHVARKSAGLLARL